MACQAVVADAEGFIRASGVELAARGDWGRLPPHWDAFDAQLASVERASVARRARLSTRPWARVAAFVPLVLLILFATRLAPTLRANGLLERASAAERQIEPEARALRFRIQDRPPYSSASNTAVSADRRHALVRTYVVPGRRGDPYVATAALAEDVTLWRRAGLDVRAPLSVDAFRQWRAGLHSKSDSVRETANEVTIETQTSDGYIKRGTVALRTGTLQVIRIQWILQNDATIEIDETDIPVVASPPKTAAVNAAVARETAERVAGELDHAEVRVWAALHHVGADLLDDVSVKRSADRYIVVSGVLATAERKRTLAGELAPLARVRQRLTSADERALRPPDSGATVVAQANARPALLASWLEQRFGTLSEQQAFGAVAVDRAREIQAQALAWRRLASRYPSRELAALSPDDRQVVARLFESHRDRLTTAVQALSLHLVPLWGDAGAAAYDHGLRSSEATVDELVPLTQRIHRLVLALFADVASTDARDEPVLSETLSTLRGDLRHAAEWLERRHAQDLSVVR